MVVGSGIAVVTVATGGTALIGPALSGAVPSVISALLPSTATSVATQTIGACLSGAVGGAATTGTVAGAVAGGSSAVGVAGIAAGPVGWLVVGATDSADGNQTTYDCWKPVVHDTSAELSSGMALRDLVSNQNIANVVITPGNPTGLPHIILENIWNEKFEIQYLVIQSTGECVCHAKPVSV